ncbi:MAG TPA: type VI secretion system contractile sheath large subunit [Polyangia bacterium]|jgi:type VI secretion system protein ImpC
MGGRMEFDFSFGGKGGRPPGRRDDEAPFRLLLIGDFSGRGARRARGEAAAPLKRPVIVDAGNLDRAFATFDASALVALSGFAEEEVRFGNVEDLHPDRLFARLALFETARSLRRELAAPSPSDETFAGAEAWIAAVTGTAVPGAAAAAGPAGEGESAASAIERLLGKASPAAGSSPAGTPTSAVHEILERAVRPHLSRDVSARRGMLLAMVDEALTALMRAVLASPGIHALEVTWRGAERIARAIDTDETLQIAFFDACAQDLMDGFAAAAGKLEQSEPHRLLAGDGRGWSVMATAFELGRDVAELQLLATLGALAGRAGAVLLADASVALVGCASAADAADPAHWHSPFGDVGAFWSALRTSPLAGSIGVVLPRVLARLPYGAKTERAETFAFEELAVAATRSPIEGRLWGSGAFAVALLLAAAFREGGWSASFDAAAELEDLPSHTYDDDGETRLTPVGEIPLSEASATTLLARGITPLAARRDRAALRLLRLVSLAEPPRELSLVPAVDD